MEPLRLLVEVPFCAFRPYTSREYQDTFPVPTPSAVYGMLLSFLGVAREEKERHRGVRMALALEGQPEQARVFRKLRRGEDQHTLRPDYQDLLLDLRLWIWLERGEDRTDPALPDRVRDGLRHPEVIHRFGGLSLGESSYLIDTITDRKAPSGNLAFLRPTPDGFYSLPVWVDHTNAQHTHHLRFTLEDPQGVAQGLSSAWFLVA
jgi:CRISPR-associated protein Cas5t